jgi:hypothetical protein
MRLPLLLAVWTGQRQGDLLRLPWTAYDGHYIRLRQSKTGARVQIRVVGPLKAALDAAAKQKTSVLILNTSEGRPWTGDGSRSSWRKACEGYHGASPASAVRAARCHEAMRLSAVLLTHPLGAVPITYAISALMCFNAARLPARVDPVGDLISLLDQDRSLWDKTLVTEGLKLLELSAAGPDLSGYHLEAAIASIHATASRVEDTDWGTIISLYDKLMRIEPSPIVALNRAIAITQRDGPRPPRARTPRTRSIRWVRPRAACRSPRGRPCSTATASSPVPKRTRVGTATVGRVYSGLLETLGACRSAEFPRTQFASTR